MTFDILAPWRRLRSNRRGNVLMLFGFAMIPMVFATGMGIDYSRAARLRSKLNAIADAAALTAVTQPMMLVSDEDKVREAATVMFEGQANILPGLDGPPVFNIELSHPDGANSRVAQVSYTARSLNAFGGILNMRTITIGGSSSAMAAAPPNMDFYIALDTSPSMALPTTQAEINTMHNKLNCSFACHSNRIEKYVVPNTIGKLQSLILNNSTFFPPAGLIGNNYRSSGNGVNKKYYIDSQNTYYYDNRTSDQANFDSKCRKSININGKTAYKDICIYNSDGTFADSYWYALNQGMELRVTAERAAIGSLMTLAKSYAETNKRTYRAALYTFDFTSNLKTIAGLTDNLDSITAASSKVNVVQVNDSSTNGCPPAPLSCSSPTPDAAPYLFTSYKSIMDKMISELPNPSGTGMEGSTPQAFLFMVTDGMSDEYTNNNYKRSRSAMLQAQINQCTAIKNRGVKIGILYTEYTEASIQDDEPNQRAIATAAIRGNSNTPNIAERLRQCASPDLMITVQTDQSISAALQTLFTKAVSSAHLIQ